jgi:hypothetical protein
MPEQIWEIGASGWFYYKEHLFALSQLIFNTPMFNVQQQLLVVI